VLLVRVFLVVAERKMVGQIPTVVRW